MSKAKPQTLLRLAWEATLSDYVTALAWFPDGARLAACSAAGEVVLGEAATGVYSLLQAPQAEALNALSLSPDGRFLATGAQSGTVTVWRMDGDSPEIFSRLNYPRAWIDRLRWHPSAPELAVSAGSRVHNWSALSQTVLASLDFQDSSVLDLVWRPQGDSLAVGGNQNVKIWRRDYWAERPLRREIGGASAALAWSPEGRYLASGNNDCSIWVWQSGNADPWLLRGLLGKTRQLAWSGGTEPMLASISSDEIVVWRQTTQPSLGWSAEVLDEHWDTVTGIAFQPGSQDLASVGEDGWLCLWRRARRLTQKLQGASQGFSVLAWNPQGTALATGGRGGEIRVWETSKPPFSPS